ncbi:MAG: archaetidylserine decarboxylase [Rhodobacterales bacterium]
MSHEQSGASLVDYLKTLPQYLMPGHAISRLIHAFTRIRHPAIRKPFTRWFVRQFGINMDEAIQSDPASYPHFNAFFTRELKPGIRPICAEADALACPVDGRVSQAGPIRAGRVFQAKGHDYSLQTLLGGDAELAARFAGGHFTTIYLSPRDYHRIHMPCAGTLREMILVPGRLFSVNPATTRVIPGLFARNERVVSIFDTEFGAMAMVKVGAVNVGSIETVWAGEVSPPAAKQVTRWQYQGEQAVSLAKGEEMGRFNMGSTVVLVMANPALRWADDFTTDAPVHLGQCIAKLNPSAP